MNAVWQDLLANLAVVASVIAAWANLREMVGRLGHRAETALLGLAMGGGAALAMSLAFRLEPGMLFDLRAAPLAVAGFFGGPLAALLAMATTLIFRGMIGGPGLPYGCIGIAAVVACATAQRGLLRGRLVQGRDVAYLAVGCSLAGLIGYLVLPPDAVLPTLFSVGLPSALLNLVGVGLAGLLVFGEERRRELAASNALHRAIFEALPDCLNVKDLSGRFRAANPATARLMRASSADELIGKTDFDFYPAETAARFRAEEQRIQEQDREETLEQNAHFPDGSTAWLSTLKAPLRDRDGRLLGLITHNRDVTQQRLTWIELQKTRQQLAAALEQMADGLAMYDRDGRILVCNNKLHALFPCTADLQVPGVRLEEVLRAGIRRGEQLLPDGADEESWVAQILAEVRAGRDRVVPMADGRYLAARDRLTADGGFLTVFSDITFETMRERDLVRRAERDPLTGVANRRAFASRLAELSESAASGGSDFAVLLMDLDHFKQVNDRFGHAAGDQLLITVAQRLEATCRQNDLVARLGGDEFAVLAISATAADGVSVLAQRLLENVTRPLQFDGVTLLPSCSIGFTVYGEDPVDPEALVLHADQALYSAKKSGRRNWASYGDRHQLKQVIGHG